MPGVLAVMSAENCTNPVAGGGNDCALVSIIFRWSKTE